MNTITFKSWEFTETLPLTQFSIDAILSRIDGTAFKLLAQRSLSNIMEIMQDPRIMPWSWPSGNHVDYEEGDEVKIDNKPTNHRAQLWTPLPNYRRAAADIYAALNAWIRTPRVSKAITSIEVLASRPTPDNTYDYTAVIFKFRDWRYRLAKDFWVRVGHYDGEPEVTIWAEDIVYSMTITDQGFDADELPKFVRALDYWLEQEDFYKARLWELHTDDTAFLAKAADRYGIPIYGKPNIRAIARAMMANHLYKPQGRAYFGLKRRFRTHK